MVMIQIRYLGYELVIYIGIVLFIVDYMYLELVVWFRVWFLNSVRMIVLQFGKYEVLGFYFKYGEESLRSWC